MNVMWAIAEAVFALIGAVYSVLTVVIIFSLVQEEEDGR